MYKHFSTAPHRGRHCIISLTPTMVVYTAEEYADMIALYHACNRNAWQAALQYEQQYGNVRQNMPTHCTIAATWKRVQETGSLIPRKKTGAPRTATDNEHALRVLQHVVENPHISTRQVAACENISQASVVRTFQRNDYHSYKISLNQEVLPTDFNRRKDFCLWLEGTEQLQPGFIENIMWTDEAHFHRNGVPNHQNSRYWATSNPHWSREASFQVSHQYPVFFFRDTFFSR